MGAILEAFDDVLRDRRGSLAILSRQERTSLTFGDLDLLARAWEERLGDVAPGESVALATGNGPAFVALFLALRRRGAVVVSMDGGLPFAEKSRICARLGVRHLLARDEGGREAGDGVRRHDVDVVPLPALPGTAVVKLTSGSTGEPVGACISEEALATGITQIAAGMGIDAHDRILVAIPLSHSYAFDSGLVSLLVLGTPLVLESALLPRVLISAMLEGEVTFFPAVPPLVHSLGQVDWPELPLRRVICAGGVLTPAAARAFHARSGRHVHQFYGATECGGICFEPRPGEPGAEGSVGMPLPGVDVRLGEAGRVEVRSRASYHGHLGRDAESAPRVVVPGDTAVWSEEGRLRLTGRTADILNVGGRKIAAAQLEGELRAIAGVREAAVVGVDDPVRGDRVVAFVVGDTVLDLPGAGLPLGLRDVRSVAALPYTERGKLDRALLRQWITGSA